MYSYRMSLSSLGLDLRSAPIVPLGTPPYEDPLPHSLSSGLDWRKITGNDCFPFAWLLPVGHRAPSSEYAHTLS